MPREPAKHGFHNPSVGLSPPTPPFTQGRLSRINRAPLCKGSSAEGGEGLFSIAFSFCFGHFRYCLLFTIPPSGHRPDTSLCTREALFYNPSVEATAPTPPFTQGRLFSQSLRRGDRLATSLYTREAFNEKTSPADAEPVSFLFNRTTYAFGAYCTIRPTASFLMFSLEP